MATIDPETGEVVGYSYDPGVNRAGYASGAAKTAVGAVGTGIGLAAVPGVAGAAGAALAAPVTAAGLATGMGTAGALAPALLALGPVGLGIIAGGLVLGGAAAIGGAIGKKKAKKAQRAQQDQEAYASAEEKANKIAGEKSDFNAEQSAAASAASAQKAARRSKGYVTDDKDLQDQMYAGPGNSYDAWHASMYGG